MFDLSKVLYALKVIWALIGCLSGLAVLLGIVGSALEGFVNCLRRKSNDGK